MVDRYRIYLNYKYENMSTRYDIPENGSFTATYSNDQTKYTIFDTKGNEICKFNVDYQKERPVHEYVYPNHVSYIEVLPNFTNRDRLIDSALGSLNIAIIPIVLSISMICCVTFFYKKKLSKPIKLLTNAYHKIEANDLDFTLSYPLNDEMGKLCHAFEKMKDCLSKNNETMFRQFAEQRRLNAAFSHDLRTPLTLLKDCFIKPNERLTLEIDVKSFYGELPAGHYRLIKQFAFFESERDWDYDTYNLSCEFTIK